MDRRKPCFRHRPVIDRMRRVRLLRRGDDWQVITDSNVPLRRAWSKALFVDLLSSLTAPYA